MSVFDGWRARLGLRGAVIEAKAAIASMRDLLGATDTELERERRLLADAERRGQLAIDIDDAETATIAQRYAAKHAERVSVLERKLVVQRDELALAGRELEEMMNQMRAAQQGRIPGAPSAADAAWRDIEAAGGTRPELDMEGELLRAEERRKLHEQAVDAQLAHLKKKLGRE